MSSVVASVVIGTAGLTLVAMAAAVLACARPAIAGDRVAALRRLAGLAVLAQAGHFGEETLQRFYVHFPAQLGLAAWPEGFFVIFNMVWFAAWLSAIAGLGSFPRLAAFPLWFLAIASVVNAVVHPLLALAAGGYFPGLWSAPVVGVLGYLLARALASGTRVQ